MTSDPDPLQRDNATREFPRAIVCLLVTPCRRLAAALASLVVVTSLAPTCQAVVPVAAKTCHFSCCSFVGTNKETFESSIALSSSHTFGFFFFFSFATLVSSLSISDWPPKLVGPPEPRRLSHIFKTLFPFFTQAAYYFVSALPLF